MAPTKKKPAAKRKAAKQKAKKKIYPPRSIIPCIAAGENEPPTIQPEVNGAKFTTLRSVTLPELWCKIEEPVHVTITEAMRADSASAPAVRKRPAALAKVQDLDAGKALKDLAVVAGLFALFESSYPDRAYVGKSFRITRHRRHERKNSLGFTVEEISA